VRRYAAGVLAADVPKITDWLQAWGSVAGALMSAGALVFTGLLLLHEIRVRREERRETAIAQARLVWAEALNPVGSESGGWTGVDWVVHNHSSSPIFNAEVGVLNLYDLDTRWPGDPDKTPKVIGPGATVHGRFTFAASREWSDREPVWRTLVADLWFIDSAGALWSRKSVMPPEHVRPF
jgi:hypothetical protein